MPQPYIVRYGALRSLGIFETAEESPPLARGTTVLVQTERGTEVGEVLCPATDRVRAWLSTAHVGKVVRPISPQDQAHLAKLRGQDQHAYQVCQRWIDRLGLPMHLVEVEQLFGGERVVFYFLAEPPESRVDFRELVREVTRELRQRIELRQIGIRDEARLRADYGDCGRPVCCNTFLVTTPPVSMRMAKLQKPTLDPSKISGRCGRLKCCFRYEYEVYEEYQRQLPPVKSRVLTEQGEATVMAQEIFAQKVLLHYPDGRIALVDAQAILKQLSEPEEEPPSQTE